MLFNSVLFLFFFALVYSIYWLLPKKPRLYFLMLASIVFYGWWGIEAEGIWGIRWSLHFLGMVGLNYLLVLRIRKSASAKRRKSWMGFAVFVNLLNLGLFKYYDFLRTLLLDLDLPSPPSVKVFSFLPLAISFYTFQLLAYTIDVYRGVIKEEHGFRNYFIFILFFPQLIAGPIMRSTDFMWQIENPSIDKRKMYDGLWLILGGLVKKVLIADPLGFLLAPVFRSPLAYDAWSIFLAGVAFSIQVYCDFSGYTDMARGVARLLGYEIPENFKAPYFSKSARELWGERWHITLNTWLRDYLYFPLGGSRVTKWRAYLNLAVVFAIGGLWHGADYSFLFWGIAWGLYLAAERYLEQELGISTTPQKNRFFIVTKVVFMFVLFVFGALMFRSQAVERPEGRLSSGQVMGQLFLGLVQNKPLVLRDKLKQSDSVDFVKLTEDVFGPEVIELKKFPNSQTLFFMLFLTAFFHWLQYKPGLFEKWRKYDAPLLVFVSAVVGGWLLPGMAVAAHQFIYFVF